MGNLGCGSFEFDLLDFRFFLSFRLSMPKACKRKETAYEPEPSEMPKNAISKDEKKIGQRQMGLNVSKLWLSPGSDGPSSSLDTGRSHCCSNAAITTWTTDPSLEREAVWPRTKHIVPLRDSNRILMASSVTSKMPSCATCFRAGLATEIVGGPSSLNRAGRKFTTNTLLS